jgi:lysophospholipase L1-like esterase
MRRINMIQRISVLFFLLLFLSLNANSAAANDEQIAVDHQTNTLLAPEGKLYRWYRNNILICESESREMKVREGGHYSVVITDDAGEETVADITVQIDASGAVIRIFTIGDSTVQDYTAGYAPRKGWGQMLPAFFNNSNVQVVNKAVGGTSSKSFYNNHWPAVRDALAAGDFVFIQFGINDRNKADAARYTPTGGEFESYLTKFVNEAKAKGAIPVLVSTVRRNAWNTDGTVYDSYHDHPVAVRTVAKSLNVPLIDLDAKAKVLMEGLGETYCTRFLYNNYLAGEYPNYPNGNADNVHFQEMGAIEMAKLVTDGIKELSGNADVSKLIPYLKPRYEVKVNASPSGADSLTTRTGSYPQGLTIHLKTIPRSKSTFLNWNNSANTPVSTSRIFTFTSGNAGTTYAAIYKGAACTASVTPAGAVSFCEGESVTLTATSGSSYIWKNGTTQVGQSGTLKVSQSGTYSVEVTFSNGCKATSSAVTVSVTQATTWYADTDGDKKGDPSVSKKACVQPAGFVADNTDLCPADVSKVSPGNCGCGKTEESCLDCNGIVNGKAVTDKCDRCVGGNTGKTECSSVAEAEDFMCSFDGVKESTNAGFKGTSYLNGTNVKGAVLSFMLEVPDSESVNVFFRYANGSANDRAARIIVNADTLPGVLSFPSGSLFTTWKFAETVIHLQAGINNVTLQSVSAEGLANIDQIGLVTPGTAISTCIVTGTDSSINASDKGFLNSFLYRNGPAATFIIFDTRGTQIASGALDEVAGRFSNLAAGIYLIKIQTADGVITDRILRQ